MKHFIGRILEAIYRFALKMSQAFYRVVPGRIRRVNARVISIGNITWGGTGKTPLVAKLTKELKDSGKNVAILTRGYGKDEVEELKRRLPDVPILVGRDRVKKAREAVDKYKAEYLILDDGFQHIRLHRDVDVVNINTTMPFGSGALVPLGILREPLEALKRANVFVLTKSDIGQKNIHWIHQRLTALKSDAVIFEAVHRPVQFMDFKRNRFLPLSEVKGRKVATICGIADPFSFEKTVEKLGAEIPFAARFDDHYDYSEHDLLEFARRCKEMNIKDAVTTEKDFYRIEPVLKKKRHGDLQAVNFLVLQIEFEVTDEEDFIRRCSNP